MPSLLVCRNGLAKGLTEDIFGSPPETWGAIPEDDDPSSVPAGTEFPVIGQGTPYGYRLAETHIDPASGVTVAECL